MKPTLQMRPTQSLTMTPQLQESLRLLQLSALEFQQEIDTALANNPFLDHDENAAASDGENAPAADVSSSENAPELAAAPEMATSAQPADAAVLPEDLYGDRWGAPARHTGGESDDDADVGSYTPSPVRLQDYLIEQLRATRLSERDQLLGGVVVEALDEDGYLRQSFEDLLTVLPAELAVDRDELSIALKFVQSLEPAGIAARSPAECLALQLERVPTDRPARALARAIVQDHLHLLAAHDTAQLIRALGCDEAALRAANALILLLDPRPGLKFGPADTRFVVADVIVKKVRGRWVASVNPQVLPRIRVNDVYVEIFRSNRSSGGSGLSQQLQEARWLVRNVQQRFHTIQRCAQAIIDRQSRYFDYGDVAMKPLLQRDIAQALGAHESTISRVTNGKYMATPRGLIEFKHFFGSHVLAEGGHPCSATAIRALIRHIIAHEDARNPLSDIKVMRKLSERGVRVARRTVTKYRDAMRIPPVEARRMTAP